jgi:putative FmdB family regulatory protein
MPQYEYICRCGNRFCDIVGISNRDNVTCPICGEVADRLIANTGRPIFNGEGWYETEYGFKASGGQK